MQASGEPHAGQLRCFDPRWIKADETVLFYGRRHSGKSVAIRCLLSYHTRTWDKVLVMSTTAASGFFDSFVPPNCIFDSLREDILNRVLRWSATSDCRSESGERGSAS